jgi:hypothetical protein
LQALTTTPGSPGDVSVGAMRFEVGEVISGEAGLTRIVHRKATVAEHHRPGRVTVRRADGSSIVVDIDEQTSVEGQPVVVMEGAWSELRGHATLAVFAADVVQAFDVVEIQHVGPAAGVRVGFAGDIADQVVADDGGLRDAPSATPVVRATLVATDAAIAKHLQTEAAVVDPGDPASTATGWFALLFAAVSMAIALGMLLAITDMTARQAGIVGLACAGALVTLRPRAILPRIWRRTSAFAKQPIVLVWVVFGAAALVGLVALTADKGVLAIWPPAMVVGLALYAVTGAVLGKTLRVVRRVAGAPDGLGEGTRTIEGTLIGDTVVARASRRSKFGYRNEVVVDVVKVEPFAFVTTDGVTVSVAPDQIVWSTTEASTKIVRESSATTVFDEIDEIRPGARIAACGRLVQDGDRLELRADGTRPAIVLATGPGGRPLAFARAAVARRRLDLVVIGLAIAAQLAVWAALAR